MPGVEAQRIEPRLLVNPPDVLAAVALGAESVPRTVMCLAVFAERGLVTVERHDKYITLRLTGGKRVDLDASPYLCALREGLDGTKGGSSV